MSEILLSVIVPTYNNGKYIRDCIESLLEYENNDMEVIIVDDGSVDNTTEVVNVIKDSRLHYYKQENQGVSSARNLGISYAKGKYVVFIDADDLYVKGAVLLLMDKLHEVDLGEKILLFDIVIHNYYMEQEYKEIKWYESTKQIEESSNSMQEVIRVLYGKNTFNSACRAVYDRELIEKYNVKFPVDMTNGEDGIFNIQYCIRCEGIEIFHQNVYIYRLNLNPDSSEKNMSKLEVLDNVDKAIMYKKLYLKEMKNVPTREKKRLKKELYCNAGRDLYSYYKALILNYTKREIKEVICSKPELEYCIKQMLFNARNIKDIFCYFALIKLVIVR